MKGDLFKYSIHGVGEIESFYPDLKMIFKIGKGDWANYLYFIPSKKVYLEKGAFGDHDAICFRVCDFLDEQSAIAWKESMELYWKKHFPNI